MLRFSRIAVVLVSVISLLALQPKVSADLSSCQATISPQSVTPGTDDYFVFGVDDSSDNAISWVQITSPDGQYFTVESSSAYQWQGDNDASSATFTQGSINSGNNENFSVEALAENGTTSSPIDWQVQASDDPGGANPISCSGDLSVTIAQPPTIINISNVGVTDVYSGGATVTWTTDAASTSEVDYGQDSSYGNSTTTDNTPVTSHSVTLSGLAPNTGYHFQAVSTTPDGGYANSGDDTLLTAIQQTPPPPFNNGNLSSGGLTSSSLSSNSPLGLTITNPADKTPPKISFTNLPAVKVFQKAPTLTGQASDNISVARVEYSTDGGQNWLPVNSSPGANTTQTNFSFTPLNLDDGTYKIIARAIDDGGNITNTPPVTIVIDRLPPTVGGNLLSFGPQILAPSSNGVIDSIAGIDQKITMSADGGPINISLTAHRLGSNSQSPIFNLTQSTDTRLWSGILSINRPGVYSLVSTSVDGAGIKTNQPVGTLNIASDPYTFNQKTHKPISSTVTLYYQAPDSHDWVIWDGSSYGQTNPQPTNVHGSYKLFVPPGTYYLKAAATGYETLISGIFRTTQSQPLTTNLGLKPQHQLSLGPVHLSLPTLAIQTINLNPGVSNTIASATHNLVGKPLPDFSLLETNGNTVHPADLLGKPTLITLGSTWSPTMSEQLNILNSLQANQNLNIIPIALQQNTGQVQAYSAIAGLNLNWLVDPDSTLSQAYGAPNLPTQIFVDRGGIVRQVVVGVLSQSQIENRLGGL